MIQRKIEMVLSYLLNRTGMNVPESNRKPLEKFLNEKWLKSGIGQIEYLKQIETDPEKYKELLNAATINETYFFREEKHFRFIEEELLPLWKKKEGTIKIWSASCSTGEEALSVYALLIKHLSQTRFKITASDLSQTVIETLKSGKYRTTSLRQDGQEFHSYISVVSEPDKTGKELTIAPQHLQKIEKHTLNLFDYDETTLPEMDLIFIRNTLIYMSPVNKLKIIGKLVKNLSPGGILLLSSSENPHISHPALKIEKGKHCYYFKKIDPTALDQKTLAKKIINSSNIIRSGQTLGKWVQSDQKINSELIEPEPPSESEVCRIITLKINNRLYKEHKTRDEISAAFFLQLLFLLEKSRYSEAHNLIEKAPRTDHPESLYYFYQGFLPFQKGEHNSACKGFKQALVANPNLWPARYYLIQACGCDCERQQNLKIIIHDINRYIENNRFDYQFLLEGFNAKYFKMICYEMLKKTESGD